MKKIAITGGKGGTGKSTIAVLIAQELIKEGKKVVLVDCDVECPNDYLLIGQTLKKRLKKKIIAEFPKLIKKKCKKCGLCAKACRSNAIFAPVGKYPVFVRDLCSGCGACWEVCPFGAIKAEKEEVGQIFVNKINNNFWLITGQVNPGLEETGPAVSQTKNFALDFAKGRKADFVLFDTAAGTHCPVISALLGSDLALCVTEGTPMGVHDLGLILDLCRKLKVKAKVIINQANLGDKTKIYPLTKKFGVEIEREVPYSKELVKAYSEGKLLDFNL
jgi:MinD superfamily P-loop ATPase